MISKRFRKRWVWKSTYCKSFSLFCIEWNRIGKLIPQVLNRLAWIKADLKTAIATRLSKTAMIRSIKKLLLRPLDHHHQDNKERQDSNVLLSTRYPRATMLQRKQLLSILAAKVRHFPALSDKHTSHTYAKTTCCLLLGSWSHTKLTFTFLQEQS